MEIFAYISQCIYTFTLLSTWSMPYFWAFSALPLNVTHSFHLSSLLAFLCRGWLSVLYNCSQLKLVDTWTLYRRLLFLVDRCWYSFVPLSLSKIGCFHCEFLEEDFYEIYFTVFSYKSNSLWSYKSCFHVCIKCISSMVWFMLLRNSIFIIAYQRRKHSWSTRVFSS